MEIKHAMIRNEVENSFFNIRLLAKLNKEYLDRMTNFRYYEENKLDEKQERLKLKSLIKILD